MFAQTYLLSSLDVLSTVVPHSLVGGAVILISAGIGWNEGRHRRRVTVRLVSWWMERVLRPLLGSRTWIRRALIIAVNNSLCCAALVAVGSLGWIAWLAVVVTGLCLGVALRLMNDATSATTSPEADVKRGRVLLAALGMGLNLLEVPAILLSSGLSLAQGALWATITTGAAFDAFLSALLPVFVVAACGEALWMGVVPISYGRGTGNGSATGDGSVTGGDSEDGPGSGASP